MTRAKWFVVATAAFGVQLVCANADAQWTSLGGNFNASYDPGLVSRFEETPGGSIPFADIYVVNQSDSSVWTNTFSELDGTFSGWLNLGGVVLSPGSGVGWGTHREVFALGTDFALYHNWSDDDATFSGWYSLGKPPSGNLCSGPSAVSWAPGRIDVFAMGCDQNLWHTWSNLGGPDDWEGWENLGGKINSAPSAISKGSGLLDVLVNNTAFHVMDKSYNAGWTWIDTGIVGEYVPSTAICRAEVDVVSQSRTASDFLSSQHYLPGPNWTSPSPSETIPVLTAPHAVSSEDFMEVYYADSSGRVLRQGCQCTSWFEAANNLWGDIFAGNPIPVLVNDADIYVFDIKSDGTLWYAYDTPY